MYTRVIKWLLLNLQFYVFVSSENFEEQPLYTNTKVEISPLLIPCSLNDVIIVKAPIISNRTRYYLNKPNGDVIKLSLNYSSTASLLGAIQKNRTNEVISTSNYKILNVKDYKSKSGWEDKDNVMDWNEYKIGALGVEDFGNWVLSAFEKDDNWIEVFQVVTLEIIEHIPASPAVQHLRIGDNFELSFAYTIDNIESCELVAPKSTRDRYYDRSRRNSKSCGYIVPNVTESDAGLWEIVGVGNIVYRSTSILIIDVIS